MDQTHLNFYHDEIDSSDDENPSCGWIEMPPPDVGSNVEASTSNAGSPMKKRTHFNVWVNFTLHVERAQDG